MHVQIINFKLEGVDESDFAALCDDLAGNFAAVPGLVRKVWLANSDTGTYGGVYIWRDRKAMKDHAKSDLGAAVANHPNLSHVTSTDFGVLEGPTRITRGSI